MKKHNKTSIETLCSRTNLTTLIADTGFDYLWTVHYGKTVEEKQEPLTSTLYSSLAILHMASTLYPKKVQSFFHGAPPAEICWQASQGNTVEVVRLLRYAANRARFLCLPKENYMVDYNEDKTLNEDQHSIRFAYEPLRHTFACFKLLYEEEGMVAMDLRDVMLVPYRLESTLVQLISGKDKLDGANDETLGVMSRLYQEDGAKYSCHNMELRKARVKERIAGLQHEVIKTTGNLGVYTMLCNLLDPDRCLALELESIRTDSASVDTSVLEMWRHRHWRKMRDFVRQEHTPEAWQKVEAASTEPTELVSEAEPVQAELPVVHHDEKPLSDDDMMQAARTEVERKKCVIANLESQCTRYQDLLGVWQLITKTKHSVPESLKTLNGLIEDMEQMITARRVILESRQHVVNSYYLFMAFNETKDALVGSLTEIQARLQRIKSLSDTLISLPTPKSEADRAALSKVCTGKEMSQ